MSDSAPSASKRRSAGRRTDKKPAPPAKKKASALRLELWPETPAHGRILAGILVVALLARVYKLLDLFPILVDESIYLRWAEIIEHEGQWLISLLDGKPPLTYWLLGAGRIVLGAVDPLLQGRLLSVLAGLAVTVLVFAIARRLAPAESAAAAGLAAAGLYAVFPFALLYDRLAYTDAFVNLCGAAIVLTSLIAFSESGASWRRELPPALAFGLGLWTKQTVLLFGAVPAVCAFALARGQQRNWLIRTSTIYLIAALFLVSNFLLTPEAPMLESHDAVLHHSGFFADPQNLLAQPFAYALVNAPKLFGYFGTYLTWPLALLGLATVVYLARQSPLLGGIVLAASILPLTVETFVLALMFPSRYAFPHLLPWIIAAGIGLAVFGRRFAANKTALGAMAALVAAPLLYQSGGMLLEPREFLYKKDATDFLGDAAHAGFGIREAIDYLKQQRESGGPFILLTDPIWGPPADALFPYLNRWKGVRVYEAWWTQLSGTHEILPPGRAEVLRSHYERVKLGVVDFAQAPRVFYVTDTNYYTPQAVQIRQPGAQLVSSFPKPGGRQAINVYRLK